MSSALSFPINELLFNENFDEENNRILPWKGEKDPYKIWLSEVILQQTRVAQGTPYYEKFLINYPTVFDLAAARLNKHVTVVLF